MNNLNRRYREMTANFATMTNHQSGRCAHFAAAGTSACADVIIMDTVILAVSIIILPLISLLIMPT